MNTFEQSLQNPKKTFSESSQEEQIERFKSLYDLFRDESTYYNFLHNVYKYTDRFKIDEMTPEQVAGTFQKAKEGNVVIKEALKSFLEIKKAQSQNLNATESSLSNLERVMEQNNIQQKTLEVSKLVNLFKWSLQSYVRGGEKIGRMPEITEDQIEDFSGDLEAILQSVNKMLSLKNPVTPNGFDKDYWEKR